MKIFATRRAFTIVELLVVVGIISVLLAILLPALQRARDTALISTSIANLNNLKAACNSYAGDWADRHFTAMPDDAGLAGGVSSAQNCDNYLRDVACPSQQVLGYSSTGGLWGYWVKRPGPPNFCPQNVGDCGNWGVFEAFTFVPPGSGGHGTTGPPPHNYSDCFGAYQMPNTKCFNAYVNNRYYDKVFYAPKDSVGMNQCEFGFENEGEFTPHPSNPQMITFPTYIWSPANMFAPMVFSSKVADLAFAGKPLAAGLGAFKAPTLGMAVFSDCKILMMEKLWLQNRGKAPALNNNFGTPRSWLFNEAYNSAPACLFIDGHTQVCAMNTAVNDDSRTRALNASNSSMSDAGKGLWHRGILTFPNDGQGGWFTPGAGYDGLIDIRPTSFGILTVDGIQGRDILKSGN